jgi:hypothetical protein
VPVVDARIAVIDDYQTRYLPAAHGELPRLRDALA